MRRAAGGEAARRIAFAGNPNVGKSTLFNALTGMRQHTGNWTGKTVECAAGRCKGGFLLVDAPGTYSLLARSAEEAAARDCICFSDTDAVAVVCDATCLERNLNLVLQVLEITPRALVCVNLLDEARARRIAVDLDALSKQLGVPVLGTVARSKRSALQVPRALAALLDAPEPARRRVRYPDAIEDAIARLLPETRRVCGDRLDARWLALRLLEGDRALLARACAFLHVDLACDDALQSACAHAAEDLAAAGLAGSALTDAIVSAIMRDAEAVAAACVSRTDTGYAPRDRRLDRLLTSRRTGYPAMLLLLGAVFYLTIKGANLPSQWLMALFSDLQAPLTAALSALNAPPALHDLLVFGVYRTVAWIVSVMLPPMAIFFPLFTLLEDAGVLPRLAYNLDRPFARCKACGKQALCMCMGLGCNAAGVIGCRIIDSPRERLIAILTNSFVPCNGRFAPPYKGKQKYGRVLTPKKKQSN